MNNTDIWIFVVVAAIVIFIITLITSVTVLHKKLVEKQIEKYEEKK